MIVVDMSPEGFARRAAARAELEAELGPEVQRLLAAGYAPLEAATIILQSWGVPARRSPGKGYGKHILIGAPGRSNPRVLLATGAYGLKHSKHVEVYAQFNPDRPLLKVDDQHDTLAGVLATILQQHTN
jgi:hypothetical protein